MLDTRAQNLLEEVLAAERLRDAHLEAFADQVAKYHGPYYSTQGKSDYAGENHYYEYLSLTVPRMIFDNPRVRIKSRASGPQQVVGKAMQYALNNWIKETGVRKLFAETAADMLFNWGVLLVTEEVNKGLPSGMPTEAKLANLWPVVSRVPQSRFFIDPAATSFNEARFMGHKWTRDKEDLIELAKTDKDGGWILKNIEEMSITSDVTELGRKVEDHPSREEVVCYEIWVPEMQADDDLGESEGFHGSIFTVAVASTQSADGLTDELNGRFIREVRPYYGPRTGPYTVFGVYKVPDRIYPLSPLVAMEGQVAELNAHAESASISASKYKKLILVDDTDPKLPQRIKSEKDLFVIPVSGLEKQRVLQAEIGGLTEQQLTYLQIARDRLDRNSGISDAQRGNVEGRGTATENQIAAEAAGVRMSFVKQQFTDAVQKVLGKVAWFFYYDDRVAMPIGIEGAEALNMDAPWLLGGDHDKESGATFDDLELEIEPYSMERTTERTHQRNVMQMYEILMSTAPAMPQMPWVRWKQLFATLGDALNLPELSDMVDTDIAMQMAGAEPEPAVAQPRFEKDLGTAGKATPRMNRGAKIPTPPDMNTLLKGQVTGIEASRAANAKM